jgi:UDP-2,4-diacetamido-2,4,6-trideoxy-beta-L-altropyranose hydrolase
MPRAIFRCDASRELGGGHVGRCLALARRLAAEGWETGFAVNETAPETVPALRDGSTRVLERGDDTGSLPALWPKGADLLVVDHYGLNAEHEYPARGWAKRILVIDDLADRSHDCEILLDQTLGRRAEDYDGLVPKDAIRLIGPSHALLRDQFRRARPEALARRGAAPARRLLIACGLGDHLGLTRRALAALPFADLPDLAVDVVVGGGAPHLAEIRDMAAGSDNDVTVHTDVSDMARLMVEADVCVGAAGTSSWERCSMGLPSLVFTAVENQRLVARGLETAGAALSLGWPEELTAEEIGARLRDMVRDAKARGDMARRAARLCDGRGTGRVLNAILPGHAADGAPITSRPARAEDSSLVFAWQSDPTTRTHFRNPKPPEPEEHAAWWAKRMASPDPALDIVEVAGQPVGLTRLDSFGDGYEVSILTAPAHRGRGIGKVALALVRRLEPDTVLRAEVKPENTASRAIFLAAGYRPTKGDEMVLRGEEIA